MRDLLDKIADDPNSKLDAVLHLGAGGGRELGYYLRLNADRVILVEAHPKQAAQLRAAARDIENVEVVEAAVAATSGEMTLRVLNKPQESSLRQPTQLLKRYPNLRVVRNDVVTTITLGQLVERLAPDTGGNNLLVLELQGEEFSVLSSTPEDVLQNFSWIAARSSRETLYEGGAQLAEVDTLLRRCGFARETPEGRASGSPFEEVLYRRDALHIRLAELSNQLKERDRAIHSLHQLLDDQTKLATDCQTDVARLLKERDEQAKVVTELQAQIAQSAMARDAQTRLAADLQAQVDNLARARDEQTKVDLNQKVELERVTKARDDQTSLVKTKQAEIDRQTRLLQDNQARIAELESQLAELVKRQVLLSEEMVKAEGQIDVIKYVLLRESNP